jgi:transcriptional regulator with XRE-family HTH domain
MSSTASLADELPMVADGINTVRERLAARHPNFATAVEKERRVDAMCQALRGELRDQRRKAGLDQAELAALLDVTQSAISKLESGSSDIGVKTLFRYAEALGLRLEFSMVPLHAPAAAQPARNDQLVLPENLPPAAAAAFQQAQENLQRASTEILSKAMEEIAAAA